MTDLNGRILLVEDNPSDAELIIYAFGRTSLTNSLDVVRDGVEALDFIFCRNGYAHRSGQKPPKVILLDLKLPKLDGLEVLRQVKSEPLTRMIPVVVLTSSTEQRDVEESYRLGANSYIVKPVEFGRLGETLRILGTYWLMLNQSRELNRNWV